MGRPGPTVGPLTCSYGPDPDQVVDVWLPPGPGPHPTVVSVHGGYFRREYQRDLHTPLARALVRSGLAVVNMEYRRGGAGGSWEQTTADVAAALTWLERVRSDTDTAYALPLRAGVALVGHSAGGYLALSAAGHPQVSFVVALAAVSDLTGTVAGGYDHGAVSAWMLATPAQDPDAYAAADLLSALPTETTTLLVHGTADPVVPAAQSIRYHRYAREAGDRCKLMLLPGQGHFELITTSEPAFAAWHAAVQDWAAR